LKIAHFTWEFPPVIYGGLGTFAKELTQKQQHFGNEVTVFSFNENNSIDTYEKWNEIDVYRPKTNDLTETFRLFADHELKSWGNHFKFFADVISYNTMSASQLVNQLVRKEGKKYDIIDAHDWLGIPGGMISKKELNLPLIFHVHSTEIGRSVGRGSHTIKDIEFEGGQVSDCIITVSYAMKDELEKLGFPQDKIRVCWNGVNPNKYDPKKITYDEKLQLRRNYGINDDENMLFFVGRLVTVKGVDNLLKAMPSVLKDFPKTKLVVLGIGDLEWSCKNMAKDFGIEDNNPRDAYGHGTHCAGIACAVGNNGKGIAGVSWNCSIMPVRAGFKFLYFGQTVCVYETDDLVEAITYAADNGADIISMSWGGDSYSNAICNAINYAYSKGCVLVAAAGNSNSDERHYPSSYDNVISVAGTNNKDQRWEYSNYGDYVDVAAPSVDILSTIIPAEIFYAEKTGTSMACPHVAGIAGLLKSKYPDSSPEMITALIKTGVDSIQTDQKIGTGRVNAYKALTVKPMFAYLDHIPNYNNIKGMLSITGSADGENFQSYKVEYGKGRNPVNWEVLFSSDIPVFHGEFCSLDTENINDGAYTIKLTVESNDNSKYTDKSMITVNNIEHQTIYVDDDNTQGPWDGTDSNPYKTLQDGIDSAGIDETVYIKKGTYLPYGTDGKGTFLIDKKIKLEGEDNRNSIITHSGKQERYLIQLKSDNVEITNCCIKTKTGKYDWGGGAIDIQSDGNHIHNNYISVVEGWESIILEYSSDNIIEDNIITSGEGSTCFRGIGLAYYSNDNIIRSNTIKNIQNAGVGVWYFCEDNLIENNTIDGPYYGVILMDWVEKNKVKDNIITNTGGDWSSMGGIIIDYATDNEIVGNTISDGKSNGMHLENEANNNIISSNNFSNNQLYGVHLDHYWFVVMPSELPTFCKNNVFYCNTFINNLEGNVRDDGSNTWYNKPKNMGNYYDDYTGSDRNDDGIGEESYTIEGWRIKIDAWSGKEILRLPITHKDRYPFIEPPDECKSKALNRFVQVKFFEKHCNLMLKLFLNFLKNHDILEELFL